MKVVLDTNVLISASFWSGASFKIMQMVDDVKIELILSKEILEEYDEILRCDEILEKTDAFQRLAAAATIQKLLIKAKIVDPKIKLNIIGADSDDNKIIEAAVEGCADFIISQDKHLLDLVSYHNIKIATPAEFLKMVEK